MRRISGAGCLTAKQYTWPGQLHDYCKELLPELRLYVEER